MPQLLSCNPPTPVSEYMQQLLSEFPSLGKPLDSCDHSDIVLAVIAKHYGLKTYTFGSVHEKLTQEYKDGALNDEVFDALVAQVSDICLMENVLPKKHMMKFALLCPDYLTKRYKSRPTNAANSLFCKYVELAVQDTHESWWQIQKIQGTI